MDTEADLKKTVLTVWKDGTYQVWDAVDALYAEPDPNRLLIIGFEELNDLLQKQEESRKKFAAAS
jgi:hypothetical protein